MGACVSCGKDDGKLEDPTVIVLYALCILRKPEESSATPYPSIFFHIWFPHISLRQLFIVVMQARVEWTMDGRSQGSSDWQPVSC